MISLTDVPGDGPANMAIRAVVDQPPVVRLLAPADDLQLSPRDLLPIQYLATDDYGVTSISLETQINFSATRDMPLKLHGDPRRQEGNGTLDLAELNLKIGDVLTLRMVAADGAGHRTLSDETRHILIAPRSIDANAHERMAELAGAVKLAAALRDGLTKAADEKGESAAADLTDATETDEQLRQALFRVLVRSESPAMSDALTKWLDDSQRLAAAVALGERNRRPEPRLELLAECLHQQLLLLREFDVALCDDDFTMAWFHPQKAHDMIMSDLLPPLEGLLTSSSFSS